MASQLGFSWTFRFVRSMWPAMLHLIRSPSLARVWAGGLAVAVAPAAPNPQQLKQAFERFDWEPYKPFVWVLHEASDPKPVVRDRALRTLAKLYDAGLTPGNLKRLIDRALDVQADPKRPWNAWREPWGLWVQQEHAAGRLPKEQWVRYVRQGMKTPTFSVRARVSRGKVLSGSVLYDPGRFAGLPDLWFCVRHADRTIVVDGLPVPDDTNWMDSWKQLAAGGSHGSEVDLSPVLDKLADGPHKIDWTQKFTVHEGREGPELFSFQAKQTVSFDLVTGSTVKLSHDPAKRPAVKLAVRVEQMQISASETLRDGKRVPTTRLNFKLLTTRPPGVGLGYSVYARSGEREWRLCGYTAHANSGRSTLHASGEAEGLPVKTDVIDLIFRPDPAVAEAEQGLFDIWDEPLTINNVPVMPFKRE